ncbi:hypothetical protein D3C80_1980430 [compost metagenome]
MRQRLADNLADTPAIIAVELPLLLENSPFDFVDVPEDFVQVRTGIEVPVTELCWQIA